MGLVKAKVYIDGHVHFYPQYNLRNALNSGLENLRNLSKGRFRDTPKKEEDGAGAVIHLLLLAERSDCNFFENSRKANPIIIGDGFRLLPGDEKETIVCEKDGEPLLYILSGRQIVTKEGLEILSLTSTLFMKDGNKDIDEIIRAIKDSGGVAALNWAPGKWFFSRGKILKRVLEENRPEDVVICDTSLRTTFWAIPKLMSFAGRRKFKIIAGSDPFPFKGEEKYVGSYGFSLTGEFDPNMPANSFRSLMKKENINISLVGVRNDIFTFIRRQSKIMLGKK